MNEEIKDWKVIRLVAFPSDIIYLFIKYINEK